MGSLADRREAQTEAEMIVKLTDVDGKLKGINPLHVTHVDDISNGQCRIFLNVERTGGDVSYIDVPGTLDDIIHRLNSKQ